VKSDLGLRPIYHQLEYRVEAHMLVAFLAYCLTATLKRSLKEHTPGLMPRAVLEKLATIQTLVPCLVRHAESCRLSPIRKRIEATRLSVSLRPASVEPAASLFNCQPLQATH
jgi:hypothetical protein